MSEEINPFAQDEGDNFVTPEEEPPLTIEEATEASDKLAEYAAEGKLTTGAELLRQMDITPPLPPLASDPRGPHPPEGLRYDFGWERTVIPADASDREREKIRDTAALVPLPLKPGAVAEWSKSQALWLHRAREKAESIHDYTKVARVGEQDIDYLFRKGHIGALESLYPSDPTHVRHHTAPDFAELAMRHGFTEQQAVRAGRMRQEAIDAFQRVAEHAAVVKISNDEVEHFRLKDEFSRAYVKARKKEEK